ncbi:MAG: DCC1-like thiol-disulfide oxidoreductase family protein [Chitinophagaceae bacterium]|nr:DCC1-like thiol-disulfide oxidoreductase family protein [Chitinophagaceae bacterium]
MDNPVILFDGVCNLCQGSVQFVLKRDKKALFRFASLQSPYGEKIQQQFGITPGKMSSFILYQEGKIFTRSEGALKMLAQLPGWRWAKVFLWVPPFIRDGIYNLIAKNRYKWFGKKEECWLPRAEWKEVFLWEA